MSTFAGSRARIPVLLAAWASAILQAQPLVTITPTHAIVQAGRTVVFQVVVTPPAPQDDCQVGLTEGPRAGMVEAAGAGQYVYTAPLVARPGTFHLVAAWAADPDAFALATIRVLPRQAPIDPQPDLFPWWESGHPVPPIPPVSPDLSGPAEEPVFQGLPPMPLQPGGWLEPGPPEEGHGRLPGREPGVD